MKKVVIYSLVWGLMGFTACQNFLEPKSQSEFVPETVQSLNEMLIGEVYMGPESGGMYNILGISDDDVACVSELKYDAQSEANVEKGRLAFSWDKDMVTLLSGYSSIYSALYKRIVGCNAILDFIDGVSGTTEQKKHVKAQALTMRAFYYLHLVNVYGKPYSYDKTSLGVPLKLSSELKTSGIPRSTVEEVYKQIIADLLEADRLFEDVPEPAQGWQGDCRATPAMTELILSRTYLYMEEWQKAVEYAEKVIHDYSFQLYDLSVVADPVQSRGVYPDFCTLGNPEAIFLFGSQADMAAMGSLRMQWQQNGPIYTASMLRASDDLVACMDETPGDLRKGIYLMWDKPAVGNTLSYYRALSKYEVSIGYNLNISYTQWGGVLKVTEAYLNAAEGAAMYYKDSGDGSYRAKAIVLLNTLRGQRFTSDRFVALTEGDFQDADALIRFVRNERRRELCFEHHRWFDLRRYGMEPVTHVWNPKEGEPVVYKLEKNDPGFTFLLPEGAFSLNPELVQNERRTN